MRRRGESARVLIVDDHEFVRSGVKKLLAGAAGLTVVGEAARGDEALHVCAHVHPDIVLVDLELGRGELNGLSLTRTIRATWPLTTVVVFSIQDGDHYRREAARAGANDYLLKGASRRELLRALRAVTKS